MQPEGFGPGSINHPGARVSMYNKLVNTQFPTSLPTHTSRQLDRKPSMATTTGSVAPTREPSQHQWQQGSQPTTPYISPQPPNLNSLPPSPLATRRVAYAQQPLPQHRAEGSTATVAGAPSAQPPPPPRNGYTPILESVNAAVQQTGLQPMHLPPNLTADDFTRAVAVATVSALRQQSEPHRARALSGVEGAPAGVTHDEGGQGGHDAPEWSRTVSASVLLGCTFLYAIIAGRFIFFTDLYIYVLRHCAPSCRNPCQRGGCRPGRLGDRRKVPGYHLVCTRTQHDRIYERHVFCSQWQHCS